MEEFTREFGVEFTYLAGFMAALERHPGRRALTCTTRETSWTYVELNAEANRLAHALRAAGLGRGDVVMASLFNTPEYVFCFIGAQKAGVVFSPINFRLAAREVALHLDDSRPRVYLYDASLAAVARDAVRLADHTPEILMVVGEAGAAGAVDGALSYEEFTRDFPAADISPERIAPTDEIVRLYTSGTTGEPKGVPLNHVNNILRALDVIMHFPLGPEDRTMNMTPWFHAGGLHSGGPCPALYVGGEVVALREFRPRDVLDHVGRYGLTYLIGTPATIELLSRTQEKHRADLRSLKGIVAMGSPLDRDSCLRYAETLTPQLYNGYGTTETFWNTILRPVDLPQRAGSAGRACTGDLVRVVRLDEDVEHVEPDDCVPRDGSTEGEVIIRSLKGPFAYYNRPEETRRRYHQGWYYTKDVGTWDEDGYVTVLGRKDNMVITGGENVHPGEVEAVINQHPKVADSLVVGVPDPVKGSVLAAYVVPADPGLSVDEVRGYLPRRLAEFKRPRFYRFVAQLPVTATGKKQHFVASRWAREDFLHTLS
jgi:long-chain acyl-CoA synthetase